MQDVRDSRTPAILDVMHGMGDAQADAVIAALLESGGVSNANAALSHLILNVDTPSTDMPEVLSGFIDRWSTLPSWTDMEKVRRAQYLFTSQGPCFGLVLMAESLPVLYCGGMGGAQVLYGTGQLSNNFRRRASQTLRFILDVMEPGGLEPMGKGIRAIQKVRLMHAAIRHYSRASPLWVGKDAAWGAPINQEELAGTLLAFSSVAIDGLRKLEIEFSLEDQECYLHAWKAVGYVLGIHEDLLPADMADARGLWAQIKKRNFIRTREGCALAAEHIKFLKELLPGKTLDGLPASMMYFLMGERLAHQNLDLPRPGWTFFLIAFVRRILGMEARLVLRSKTLRRLTSEAGAMLMESLYRTWNRGDGSPFRIPASMTKT